MKYVIIRDDDTNALTPIECLETLYRPFLDKNLPVCLATIPNVRSHVFLPNGQPEGFVVANKGVKEGAYPIGSNDKLVAYLKANSGYQIVHHGYHHEFINGQTEFDIHDRADLARRLDSGTKYFLEAGFPQPRTFVAPYDRITRVAYKELAARFEIISTGWFELGRIPLQWWPQLALQKITRTPHWKALGTTILSHPGCLLSYHRPYPGILDTIKKSIDSRKVTVLVTHWWEFFRENQPDHPFIQVIHETAAYLASRKDIKVIRFSDLIDQDISLKD